MDGNFNAYLPYNQQQPSSSQQQAQQQHSLGSFSGLPQQPHHQQQQDSSTHTTLPPLQGQNGYAQLGSMPYGHHGSQSHTPAPPLTPASSSMSGNNNNNTYAHMSPSHASHGSMLPPSSFNPPYNMSQSMLYPSSTPTSLPTMSSLSGLPTIRPMPPGMPVGSLNGMAPSLGPGHNQQSAFMQSEEAPTHVVGSQGRRGILPSAPGRPNPPPQGSAAGSKSMIPQKDADGKYPCPHCQKTYLHAKHLKRHLLRHTGDRPYMCHLCKDTFSRSDILKRHFQKCSIRRGNPTGANHLAHQRRNTNGTNRLSIGQQDGPIGLAGLPEVAGSGYGNNVVSSSPTVTGDMSGRSTRANSLITPGSMSHRNSVAGLGILGSNAPNNEQPGTTPNYQPGMTAYAMQNGGQMHPNYAFGTQHMNGNTYHNPQQPMSFLGQTSSRFSNSHITSPHPPTNGDGGSSQMTEWHRMFNAGGQDGFVGGQPANASSGANIKTEHDTKGDFTMQNDLSNESFLGSLYSHPSAFGSEYSETTQGIPGFPNWSLDDPLQAKVDSLTHFCFPGGFGSMQGSQSAEIVRACLTSENVKHFAEHYTSYQGHWPILHMPTFKLTDANNGLVLTMLCIGAVYSPLLDVGQVRQMMEFAKATVVNNSSIFRRAMNGPTDGLGATASDVEELQALLMLQMIFTWHGDHSQRQAARDDLPTLARIAKMMGLMQTAGPGHYAYSALHSSQHRQGTMVDSSNFDWYGWLEQEKRNRLLYLFFLTDAAMVMYFNSAPQFDALEVRLMLPADDAAWDARDGDACANALGLNGPQAQGRNLNGTRRPKQPGMREAMRTLMDPAAAFQPGATNAYAKFVLIHALIIRIITCQKLLLHPESLTQGFNFTIGASGPATPLSQNDWLDQHGGSGSLSATNSGRVTPTDGTGTNNGSILQEKKRLSYALDKWKRAWDTDMEFQYPPSHTHLRRFGFSRDGVHFFFLGRSFLQSQRVGDWTTSADVRFKQVMALLKRIKAFVVGDNEMKGHDIGSVGDIDDQYGLDNLTLDMKLLFKPYNSLLDSPVAGVQTSAF